MFLSELRQPVSDASGLGPAAVKHLAGMGVRNIAQLVRHYPLRYEDRQKPVPLAESSAQNPACTVATVLSHSHIRWKKGLALKIVVEDDSARASLLCFGRNFLAGKLPVGLQIRLSGPFEKTPYGEIQSGSFIFEKYSPETTGLNFGRILPVYPLAGSLTQTQLRKAMQSVLSSHVRGIASELPAGIRNSRNFPEKQSALHHIHFPPTMEEAERARKALIFEELFLLQLTAARRRPAAGSRREGQWSDELVSRLESSLPFRLTPDQQKTLGEIRGDVLSGTASRLVQGEVGSGKTLVAFLAALGVIGRGGQAAFMAPTELLARQHADNAGRLLTPLGVKTAFLSGDVSSSSRKLLFEALRAGDIDLLVGTHALFGEDVVFKNLALAIVDEQQRFGVEQRRLLSEKGRPDQPVHILALSATPIPRTLALTAFGDMDISTIRTMPAGRIPVETHLTRMGNEENVYSFVRRELHRGHQAYFVYPLIEESEKSPLKDAENMYASLSRDIFPEYPSALVHSRIEEEAKRQIMQNFRDGTIRILVATSVVEVGVDVPQATCMVVEHAERFGLSALHQLRGRVGRGQHKSYCLLIYADPLSEDGKHRMRIMKDSSDGFLIAEEDMKIRGPGDMAGTRQSGFLKMSIADPVRDIQVLMEARETARKVLETE